MSHPLPLPKKEREKRKEKKGYITITNKLIDGIKR